MTLYHVTHSDDYYYTATRLVVVARAVPATVVRESPRYVWVCHPWLAPDVPKRMRREDLAREGYHAEHELLAIGYVRAEGELVLYRPHPALRDVGWSASAADVEARYAAERARIEALPPPAVIPGVRTGETPAQLREQVLACLERWRAEALEIVA